MDRVWKPHKRQEQFASLPDSVFEALYGGAAGGGKSELLLMLPIIRGWYKEPRFKGIIFRRTYPELESEIIVRSREWYPLAGGSYNEDKKRWTFAGSGAIMQFGHVEYESDVRKYDTAEYNYMGFDELTSFTKYQYIYLTRTRVRSSTSRLHSVVRSATNPGNIGHAWVREHFIEPAPFGTIVVDKRTGLKRIFIQSFAQDNPYLMENDPGYINRLRDLPEAERRAKLDGDWYTFEGQVFDDYREAPMEGEPEEACHLVIPFKIPDWWLRFLAIDWGYTAMTCALWGALSPNDRLYVYREYTVKQAKTSTWANEVGRLSRGEEYKDIVLCRSAWQQRGDEQTQEELFTKHSSGLRARQADNDRIAGKLLLQEYLRWKKKTPRAPINEGDYNNDIANKILRMQGVDAYKNYVDSFSPIEENEVLPKIQIFPDCLELRKCIPLCIYDKKSNVTNKPAEDVKEFDGDDPYDTCRYLVCSVDNYLGSQSNEADHRSKVNQILENFQRNQDYNYLHRAMERVESQGPVHPHPIKRYHARAIN